MQNYRLRNQIKRLLSPQDKLAPWVFSSQGQMLNDIRNKLEQLVYKAFEPILKKWPAVKLKEIFLCGSLVSFSWHDGSDFDLLIELSIDTKNFFIKNEKKAVEFVRLYFNSYYKKLIICYIDGKKVDMLIKRDVQNPIKYKRNCYSVTNNCWITFPSHKILDANNEEKTIKKVVSTMNRLRKKLFRNYITNDVECQSKIKKYFYKLWRKQFDDDAGHLFYKLLKYEKLGTLFADSIISYLTITYYKNFDNKIFDLYHPNKELNPDIFTREEKVKPEIRAILLKQINNVFSNFNMIPGICLTNAYLCGSQASYWWQTKSDFDVWIAVSIDKTKSFIKSHSKMRKLLKKYLNAALNSGKIYQVNGRLLDVKISNKNINKMYGVYSLMDDCWFIKPDPEKIKTTDIKRLYSLYKLRKTFLIKKMLGVKLDERACISSTNVKDLTDTFDRILKSPYKDFYSYLVFKLLGYEHITYDYKKFLNHEISRSLSIEAIPTTPSACS